MNTILIDNSNINGKTKFMNAVNNGPVPETVRKSWSNFQSYKEAGISYARNHDASFFTPYGGEHIVDVHRIFKNFDADENDPASYVFAPTDKYLKATIDAGTKVFYRLGASIEHGHKVGTYPPKDFKKWARICEHIIMHYNEGWADGFNWGIEYWEIWNEPECRNPDGGSPCWQGSAELFAELYVTASKYLKEKFPALKIGGPAFTTSWPDPFKTVFFEAIVKNNAPLDFYSWHCYSNTPDTFAESVYEAKKMLKQYGFENTETCLNEWNYIRGWLADEWKYSVLSEKGLKGSAFIASSMAVCQKAGLDMLMYYDARPSSMCGMFDDWTYEPLKGYYPYLMVRDVIALGDYVETEHADSLYSFASTNGKDSAVMVTYYNETDGLEKKDVKLSFKNMGIKKRAKASFYLLDEANNATHIKDEYVSKDEFDLYVEMTEFSTVLVKIEQE